MIFAISDTLWVGIINAIVTALLGLAVKWLDTRSKDRAAATAKKVEDVQKTVDSAVADVKKIEVATNSMKDALVKATRDEAHLRGKTEERDRADGVTRDNAATEAEVNRRIEAAKSEGTAIITNDPVNTVATNVEVIKRDVKDVKRDVKDVKTEVTKEVKAGIKQGIAESKED